MTDYLTIRDFELKKVTKGSEKNTVICILFTYCLWIPEYMFIVDDFRPNLLLKTDFN